jgi:hypothetical protein
LYFAPEPQGHGRFGASGSGLRVRSTAPLKNILEKHPSSRGDFLV